MSTLYRLTKETALEHIRRGLENQPDVPAEVAAISLMRTIDDWSEHSAILAALDQIHDEVLASLQHTIDAARTDPRTFSCPRAVRPSSDPACRRWGLRDLPPRSRGFDPPRSRVMSTGHYVEGGHDVDGPRRDAWIPASSSSSRGDDAPGCPMAIPQAVVMTVRLLFTATMARVRRGAR